MAAPSIVGYSEVHDWRKDNSTAAAVAGTDFAANLWPFETNNVTGGFGTAITEGDDSGSVVAGTYGYYTTLTTTQSINTSGEALVPHARVMNADNFGYIKFVLFSGAGTGEYRIYGGFPPAGDWVREQWYPVVLGDVFESETAGFNNADITKVGAILECTAEAQGYQFRFNYGNIFKLNSTGLVISGGEVGDAVSLDAIRLLVQDFYNTSGRAIQYPITVVGGLAFASDFSLDIDCDHWEDGGISLLLAGDRTANSYRLNVSPSSGDVSGLTVLGPADIVIDSTVSNLAIYAESVATGGDFLLEAGADVADIGVLKKSPRITGGLAKNVVFSSCNPLQLENIDSDSSIAIRDAIGILADISLAAGNYSTLRLDLDSGVVELSGGGGSYDFSGLTATGVIELDATDGGSYTISVAAGVTAIAKDPQTNGSVTIVAPEITLTISGVPSGGILTIWDDEDIDPQNLGTALQVTNPTPEGEIDYIGSPGNDIVIQFVPDTGDSADYKELNFPFTFPSVSQTLNLAPSLEPEDSL